MNISTKANVETGRHSSIGEVARKALLMPERADQSERHVIENLREAWDQGIASGDGGPLDIEKIKAEGRRRLAAR